MSVKTIVLRVGDPVMQVDAVRTFIDATGAVPVIIQGRTMLPVRAIVEALGGTVSWDAGRRAVGVILGAKTLELIIAKSLATVNGTSDGDRPCQRPRRPGHRQGANHAAGTLRR